MSNEKTKAVQASTTKLSPANDDDVAQFLTKMREMPPAHMAGSDAGRLVFAMDATMSRQPSWDHALHLQADMFAETARIGGLDVQLVYFRGFNECKASKWVSQPQKLAQLMSVVECRGGHTQISKVLSHIMREQKKDRVNAVIYVGDAMEEKADSLCRKAGELRLLGIPLFMFQEGNNPAVEKVYREMARLSGGAYCRFDHGAAASLRDLLRAVAVYAAGGRKALADHADSSASGRLLLEQLS